MRNRFAGRCRICRSEVEPEGGELEGERGSWSVVCDSCLEERRATIAARESGLIEQAQANGQRIVPRARLRTIAVQEAQVLEEQRQRETDVRAAQEQEAERLRSIVPRDTQTRRIVPRRNPILILNQQPDELLAVVERMAPEEQDDIFRGFFRRGRQAREAAPILAATQIQPAVQPQLSPEDRQVALNYRAQGYRVISKSKMIIARIDRQDWRYADGMRSGTRTMQGTQTLQDYYRRNISKDRVTLTNKLMLSVIGGSSVHKDEPGFVVLDPDWKPEKKVRRRGMEL